MNEFHLTRPEGVQPRGGSRAIGSLTRIPQWRIPIITVVLTALLLGLVAISPVFLNQIGRDKRVDWRQLGNVGQAYGGASAILAGIALVGIAVSLLIQMRQARTERVRLVRERHAELLQLVLDNPGVYAPALGTRTPSTSEEIRQFLFLTMYMNYTLMGYELDVINKETLTKEIFPSVCATEPFMRWWKSSGDIWSPQGNMSRKERQFKRLLNDQYLKVLASGQLPIRRTIDKSIPDTRNSDGISKLAVPISGAIGVCVGVVLRSAIRRALSEPKR